MKNAFTVAALGLAIAIFALGPNSASADHCHTYGHGTYYGGGYYGSGYYGGVRVVPTYDYGYRSYYGPSYRTYVPTYGGSYYYPSGYGSSYYRSGYSYGVGFGAGSLFIPGLIGG